MFFCFGQAFSQDLHTPMAPGRTIETGQPKSYEDSAEFAKLFKEFYPFIKPAKSLHEQSEEYFHNISRSFTMQGIHPHDVGTILDREGVAVRSGHHCAMPVMTYYELPATVRASFGCYNTHLDIDRLVAGLERVREVFA